jgi:hypothetical protein
MILFASSAVASDELTKYVYEKFDLKNASKYTISTGYAHKGACVFNGSFYFTNIDGTPTSINLYKKMVHWVDMDRHTEIKNNFVRFGKFPAPEQLFELIHKDDELIFRMQTPHNGSTLVCDLPFRKVGLDEDRKVEEDSLSVKTICSETDALYNKKDRFIYLPPRTTPFSGKNLCKYKNGQNKEIGNFKDGKRVGKWTWWHNNGQKRQEGNFKDGKAGGKWTWWYENGQKQAETNYKDGKEDGKGTGWKENGQLDYERMY